MADWLPPGCTGTVIGWREPGSSVQQGARDVRLPDRARSPAPPPWPAGFAHPHRLGGGAPDLLRAGLILRVQVGSGVHATASKARRPRTSWACALEPPQFVTGLARVPNGVRGVAVGALEQYERHTAVGPVRRGGEGSGAGDLGCRHLLRPQVGAAGPGGTRPCCWCCSCRIRRSCSATRSAPELTANAHRFVSRLAPARYLGYLKGRRPADDRQAGRIPTGPNWWRPRV